MEIIILTEGNSVFGLGHISRCLAFYDAFCNKGLNVNFIIDGDYSVENLVAGRRVEYIAWLSDISVIRSKIESKVIFVDSIRASQVDVDYILKYSFKLIVIDDYCRRFYEKSIVIDWTANVEKTLVHKHNKQNNILLLGLKYSVIRKAFITENNNRKSSLRHIMLTFGGSDVRDLTTSVVRFLAPLFPDILFEVVIGPASKMSDKVNYPNVFYYCGLDALGMASLMKKSDIAISAGGQTLYELVSLGVPTIAVQVVDNQSEDICGLYQLGVLSNVFMWNSPNLLQLLADEIKYLTLERRQYLTKKAQQLEIGKGLYKIVDLIIKICDNVNCREQSDNYIV